MMTRIFFSDRPINSKCLNVVFLTLGIRTTPAKCVSVDKISAALLIIFLSEVNSGPRSFFSKFLNTKNPIPEQTQTPHLLTIHIEVHATIKHFSLFQVKLVWKVVEYTIGRLNSGK